MRLLCWEAEECKAKLFLSTVVVLVLIFLLLLHFVSIVVSIVLLCFFHLQVLCRASYQSHCESRISTGNDCNYQVFYSNGKVSF